MARNGQPVRLAIVDRSTAVCPLVRDDELGIGEPTAAVISRGQLLDALLALFESRMMALAGVDTRTGLAFQAAKRGWI